ncbi:hypothetical protein HYS50_03130 [Candidatus Woesearchaeota archaeon]|nr:hypothetical protein [Candidatus Woesearchaeota archaeon]
MNNPLFKTKERTRKISLELILAGMISIGAGAGVVYYLFADTSPYGRKKEFPSSFYGRTLHPDNLHPSLREAYLGGYANENLIIKVLNGDLLNREPVLPQTK